MASSRSFSSPIRPPSSNEEGNPLIAGIGIRKALRFEEQNQRVARELGDAESEQAGYDIESQSRAGVRLIEVKSSRHPRADIFLSANQFKSLNDNKDRYYVYFVGNAYSQPRVYVISAAKLLSSTTKPKVIISERQWRYLVEQQL